MTITIRPLINMMIVTGSIAIVTGVLLPSSVIEMRGIKGFSEIVASIVPCVEIIAKKTADPVRAEITWALQWALFPIQLAVWLWTGPVWGKEMRLAALKTSFELPETGKKRAVVIIGILTLGTFIFSDLGIIHIFSFLRGTPFEGDPSKLPSILRVPFSSKFGMIFYAWLIPLSNTFVYWMFLHIVVNFQSFFKDAKAIDQKLFNKQSPPVSE